MSSDADRIERIMNQMDRVHEVKDVMEETREIRERKQPTPSLQLFGYKEHIPYESKQIAGQAIIVEHEDEDREFMEVFMAAQITHEQYLHLRQKVEENDWTMEQVTYQELSDRILQNHEEDDDE